MRPQRFLHWPSWRHLGLAAVLGSGVGLLFLVVYGGSDWLARQHAHRVRWHFDSELAIPFVPATSVLYLSLTPLLWLAPFVLRTRRELVAFAASLCAATLVAAVFFLAAPGDDAFPRQDETSLGIWAPVVHLARNLALRHNYSPSLHVAFTTICLLIYSRGASLLAKSLLGLWCAGIVASTLLLHQHYVIDVAAGLLLGWLTVRLVYRRMTRLPAARAAGKPPASADPHPMQVV